MLVVVDGGDGGGADADTDADDDNCTDDDADAEAVGNAYEFDAADAAELSSAAAALLCASPLADPRFFAAAVAAAVGNARTVVASRADGIAAAARFRLEFAAVAAALAIEAVDVTVT